MLVACGVAVREGRVLVCRRPSGVPYAGWWEFPSELLQGDETLEDCLEKAFFERLSVRLDAFGPVGTMDSACDKSYRIFTYLTEFNEKKLCLTGYDCAKWVNINKLRNFRLFPDCVTIVKEIKKFF